jgi:serine phosphatase RsbU (regulator of sigma subunit)
MFRLRVTPAHGEPFEHPLGSSPLVVGRASECGLVIADRFLSRRHARLFLEHGAWLVEDLGSRNGTLLNGRRIERAEKIKEGDQLQLSGSVIAVLPETPTRSEPDSALSELSEHTIFRRASDLMDSQAEQDDTESDMPQPSRRYTDRLRMLNDVHQALARSIELDDLLDLILGRAFEHLQPEEGVIYLKSPDASYYRAAFRSLRDESSDYLYSSTLITEVIEKGLAALVLDVESDERFSAAKSILASGVRSLVAAPLLDSEGSLGMIALNSRVHRRQFSEEDMELLVSLASVAALRIRNLRLAVEAAERRRLEEEMRLARQIQVALLPDRLPDLPGYGLHAGNIPSLGVSGDYYEVVERNNETECVMMIADVSGKGIAASLLTASLEALAAGPIEVGHPPERVCQLVSRRLFRRTPAAKYATAFMVVLEHATGKLTYCNAGHNPSLLVRASGEIELLGPTGLPLGLVEEAPYASLVTELRPGDNLVLYTDGITEALDPHEEEYGSERLQEVCKRNRGEAPAVLFEAIESDLEEFAQGQPFHDDRTLLLLQRLG